MKELKARREELKIKQQDLADQLGISRTQLSRYENGLREADESIIEKWRGILFGLKFSDLEVGDYVYVCDDLENGDEIGSNIVVMDMQRGCLVEIMSKPNNREIRATDLFFYSKEMIDLSRSMKREDYLKMNKSEYNLDYVYKIAHKAYKDNLIDSIAKFDSKENSYVEIYVKGRQHKYWCTCVKRAIDFIQSLYTEEFIIEKMADELKIKPGAEVALSNGIKCVYFDDGDRKLRYDGDFYPCNFLVLKGATVKQSKGAK